MSLTIEKPSCLDQEESIFVKPVYNINSIGFIKVLNGDGTDYPREYIIKLWSSEEDARENKTPFFTRNSITGEENRGEMPIKVGSYIYGRLNTLDRWEDLRGPSYFSLSGSMGSSFYKASDEEKEKGFDINIEVTIRGIPIFFTLDVIKV